MAILLCDPLDEIFEPVVRKCPRDHGGRQWAPQPPRPGLRPIVLMMPARRRRSQGAHAHLLPQIEVSTRGRVAAPLPRHSEMPPAPVTPPPPSANASSPPPPARS